MFLIAGDEVTVDWGQTESNGRGRVDLFFPSIFAGYSGKKALQVPEADITENGVHKKN